ncbi:MAG: PspC domain-containing protein [Candidatus Pacebacteria bacterium]|nr:PspC domain-containing protein [Candidatus Paceibacterota bacterium]
MAEETKKFFRSRKDRIIFGVCGGLGKYFNIDPILFRLFFVLLLFTDGAGIPLYIIMTVITPLEPGEPDSADKNKDFKAEVDELAAKIDKKAKELSSEMGEKDEDRGAQGYREILGIIIIIFGLFFMMRTIFPMMWLTNDILGPMAIIAIGILIAFKK